MIGDNNESVHKQKSSELFTVLLIADNEFQRIIRHPLVIVVSCILVVLAVLNGMGSSMLSMGSTSAQDAFVAFGVNEVFSTSVLFCGVVALFIGVMSLAEETSARSIGVLLVKPLYRRDVLVGKFLAQNLFIFLLIAANFILCSLLLTIFMGEPSSISDLILRLSAYILVVFLFCSATMSVAMLIGAIFKDILQAAILAITFYYADLNGSLGSYMGGFSMYTPQNLFSGITTGTDNANLLDTTQLLSNWLNGTTPYMIMIILEILATLIISLLIFSRSGE